jgi:hypothetical protein
VVSRQWTVVQFVVSRQWTVVQFVVSRLDHSTVCGEQTVDRFPLGNLFSWRMCHHKRWSKARKAKDFNWWTKCETCGGHSCRKLSSDVRGNITSYRDFINISIPYFDKRFAWLLNRKRNAWKLQHYWNKDLTLKVKHSCIELSLLTKRGLQTLNWSWNRSQTSGEVQPPRDPENFDERNHRSS